MSDKETKVSQFNRFSSLGMNIPEGEYDPKWVTNAFSRSGRKFIKAFEEDWDQKSGIKITIVAEYNGEQDVDMEVSEEDSGSTDMDSEGGSEDEAGS